MNDLPLSLLSRGCGRFVSPKGNTGRHDGRLDVCFTPQDYYIWKSQHSLLRLSNSGRLLVEAESTLPKTYSTRRGPLLLYSQHLVSMESSCHSDTRDRKQRVVRRYTQQVAQQLSTVKELSAAILSYSNTQFTTSRPGPLFFPPLQPPLAPDLLRPSPASPTTQEQLRPESLAQLNPLWLPAKRSTVPLDNQPEDKEEEQGSRKRVRLDLFLQIPCTSRTPTPQMEPHTWVHYVAVTPEEPEGPQSVDIGLQHTEIKHHSMGGELHHPDMNWVQDMADDEDCSIQDSGMTSDEGNYERPISGNRHERRGLLPPLTLGHSICNGPCWERQDGLRWEGPSSDEHHARRLPPIAESHTDPPGWGIQAQTQQDARPKADRVGFQSQENLNRLHQQSLILPLLFPGNEEEMSGQQRGGGGKTERQYHKKETAGQGGGGGGGGIPSDKGSRILLELGEERPPPVGVLGWVAGRKGPGKWSSFAFLQNRLPDLQDPCEPSDANRGVVRGVLPLELRDLQNDKSVGSLILGPDGEIIQLSLYDNSQDSSHSDGDTREQEGAVELNTDVPVGVIQQHQSVHKVLDLPRLTETEVCSPSSQADTAAVTKKKTKRAEAASEIWGKDAKNNVRMPPLREQERREEPRGGNTEAEEEDEEEELSSTGQTSHLSGSRQPGKREMKTVKSEASDGQKTSRTRGEGRRQRQKTGSDTRSVRSQKPEERTNREAAETQGRSALPSVKKRMKDREGEQGEVKTNEERDERGEVGRRKEESAGRRKKRGSLKHKKLVVEDSLKKEEMEISQEMHEGSRIITTKRPPATQSHNNDTETNPEEDTGTERLSTDADKRSSVPSASSLGSAAAAATSGINRRSLRRSAASSCEEGAAPASALGLASSRGRLSSCSTVMVGEEQLTLNPVKPEFYRPRRTQEEEEEAAALRLAQRAEKRRQEVERKRREREEEERKQQEREQTEEKMKSELEEERRKRAEDLRLRKLAEEQERRKREEEERERGRREQEQRERERRRQEERRRQMEHLRRMREEEEQRSKAELERLRLEEERRQEEESKKLQEMDRGERIEYLCRKEQEEEKRKNKEEERKRREEEAALQAEEVARLQAELLSRQMALLQQQLAFKRALVLEAGGLEKTQAGMKSSLRRPSDFPGCCS